MENEEQQQVLKEIQTSIEIHPQKNYLHYYAHKHPLKLYHEDDGNDHNPNPFIICSGCSLPINASSNSNSSSNYCCKKCRQFFHISCAESPTTIHHPFHMSHSLSLLQSPPQPGLTICSACNHNIIPGSANSYGCLDCRIFFHDFCLQLPPKLKHDLHSYHLLFLISSENDFKCRGCSTTCSGFSYSCRKCDFPSKFCLSCMFSPPTILECSDQAVAHVLTIHSASSLDDSTSVCRVCAKEIGSGMAFFRCSLCRFYLHIHCVLQPTFESPHHRHILQLHEEDQDEEDDEFEDEELICDHCEKTRYSNLPVYQCPQAGCSIVAHCYCALMEENLSIAHKLGDEISIVVIKDPPITLREEIVWCCEMELEDLNDLVANNISDGNEWSNEALTTEFSMLSIHPLFTEFFENYEPRVVENAMDSINLYHDSVVVGVWEYSISRTLAPVMELLFANYGDFSKNSILSSSRPKILFFNVLCHAMFDICCTKDEEITKFHLWSWLDCFKFVHSFGFEIHFARQRFKKAFNAFFGSVHDDETMDKLDMEMKRLGEDVEASKLQFSTAHCITSIMNKDSIGEIIKLEVSNSPGILSNTSWNQYMIETRREQASLMMNVTDLLFPERESSLDGFSGFMDRTKDMTLWDYDTLLAKIERFFIIRSQENLGGGGDTEMVISTDICSSNCELRSIDIPFNLCTKCDLLVQTGCDMLEKVSCLDYGDHDLSAIANAPSPFDLIREEGFYYAIDRSCCVCALPIWGSAYTCDDHQTLIHKFCINYPQEFHHIRLHPAHTLSLDLEPTNSESTRICNACGDNCHYGQIYSCKNCNFYLESKCTFRELLMIRSTLHGHQLALVEQNTKRDPKRDCNQCRKELPCSPYLHCGLCDVSFCVWCALPSKAAYSRHYHELGFVHSYVEDESGEYYCDACEQRRVPNHPVYRCMECAYVAHIGCVASDLYNN
ncbi:uncharacterized protein LOC124928843 [Impatiens glandulifera]|uniref:uncharacterized protein LOC124928843 n=1 Tax=Impatiens glandulifera TaxID=253017 RepID=UPI001FB15464|nr:uncharacterized protein LOC124928843 [Impatiens glandulifera]